MALPNVLPGAEPSDRASALLAQLRARQLDRTLTSVLPAQPRTTAPLALPAIDQMLRGGVPRGQVSEIVGPASSGRTTLAWAGLAAATRRGEWVALVDTFDRFDPERAAAAGVVLPQLLWVRGQALSKTAGAIDPAWVPGGRSVSGPGTLLERTVDRALKALNLIVQSGVCTWVVIDLVDLPGAGLARIPRSTWLRIQRVIEGSETVVVLLAASPVARSAGGVSITTGGGAVDATGVGSRESGVENANATGTESLSGEGRFDSQLPTPNSPLPTPDSRQRRSRARWKGTHDRSRRLGGLATGVRITSPRGWVGEVSLSIG